MAIHDLIRSGKYDRAMQSISDTSMDYLEKLDVLIKIYLQTNNLSEAEKCITELLKNTEIESKYYRKARLQQIYLSMRSGNIDTAHRLLKKYEEDHLCNSVDVELSGLFYHITGSLHLMSGNLNSAEKALKEAKAYREKTNDLMDMAITINNLGVVSRRKGELQPALLFYRRALKMFQHLENTRYISMTLNNLAIIHSSKGEIYQAKRYHEQNLQIYKEMDDKDLIARTLSNLSTIYRDLGELDTAIQMARDSVKLREKSDNMQNLYLSYYFLILNLIEAEQLDKVQQEIDKMELLLHRNMTNLNRIRYEYITAFYNYKKPRLLNKTRAMEKFGKLAKMNPIDPDINFASIIYLIELLFFEMMSLNNENLLSEIEELLELLMNRSKETAHYVFYLKSILLSAKLETIKGDLDAAEDAYTYALHVSNEYHLSVYQEHIQKELSDFRNELSKWIDISEQQKSLVERVRASMIGSYLKEVKKMIFET